MWPVAKPHWLTETAYARCTSRLGRRSHRQRVEEFREHVLDCSAKYDELGINQQISSVPEISEDFGKVIEGDLKYLYDGPFRRKGSSAREIYDSLLNGSAYKFCSLCGHREVATLDHFFPKGEFPVFSVTPFNLVPVCWECNHKKGDYFSRGVASGLIHPYYDCIFQERWLSGRLVRTVPPVTEFCVNPPSDWSSITRQRIINHFDLLELGALYSDNAATELSSLQYLLRSVLADEGGEAVSRQLKRYAESCEGMNSNWWRSVAYSVWSEDEWFCNGGFEIIPSRPMA